MGYTDTYSYMVSATGNPTGEADVVFMQRTTYVTALELFPRFQGGGIGTGLFMEFVNIAKQNGFEYLAGHFRQGSSKSIAMKLNQALHAVPFVDWCGSGETYYYVVARTLQVEKYSPPT